MYLHHTSTSTVREERAIADFLVLHYAPFICLGFNFNFYYVASPFLLVRVWCIIWYCTRDTRYCTRTVPATKSKQLASAVWESHNHNGNGNKCGVRRGVHVAVATVLVFGGSGGGGGGYTAPRSGSGSGPDLRYTV